MLALGIDPGTAICGYGLVKEENSSLIPIKYGVIRTDSKMDTEKRLLVIFREIESLIQEYKPDLIGVEELFFSKNVKTAITVCQARGVILLAAAKNDLKLREFNPLTVKQSVVGYGKAEKEQVILMTQRLLNLPNKPHPDDAADALAIAICAIHHQNSRLGKYY